MKYHVNAEESEKVEGMGHTSIPLLGEANGCSGGCCSGISIYHLDEYNPPGVHSDQEGFYVLEGTGWVRIGEEEIRIRPETAFLVPPGKAHSIRREKESGPVKVFWFHAAC